MPSPHELLGVSPTATRAEVTEAFRRFALRHHPDRGGDAATFSAGLDAYRQLVAGGRRRARAQGDVVFHRRTRPGVTTMLRVAGRRLSTVLSRP